jgi:hypothetical protein
LVFVDLESWRSRIGQAEVEVEKNTGLGAPIAPF